MAFTFAVAGKGGMGKTTLAALLIKLLVERGQGPVFAVDADPNPTLGAAMGWEVERTIGDLRDDLLDNIRNLPPGLTKNEYLELGLQECLCEGKGVDLLVMGRGEGPRCYCAVNSVLRRCIDRLRDSYRYVIIDNEAGLEHLSRCTTQDVNALLIVSSEMPVALQSAIRIHKLVDSLSLRVEKRYLVINNLNGSRSIPELDPEGPELLGVVPCDPEVIELGRQGRPVADLGESSLARKAVAAVLDAALPGRS